jgi:hypothetical protein
MGPAQHGPYTPLGGDGLSNARMGSVKMPQRKGRPVTDSRPQKDRSKPKAGSPRTSYSPCTSPDAVGKTARTGGELSLRGRIGPAWLPFEDQVCFDVAEHDESTDRTNGDKNDNLPGRNALHRRNAIRSRA